METGEKNRKGRDKLRACWSGDGAIASALRFARKKGPKAMATLMLTYTPRRDVDLEVYHKWLQEVDNPFFNSQPVVKRYVNYKVAGDVVGAVGFTHFDILEIEGDGGPESVFGDAQISAFAKNWVKLWGNVPDPDLADQSVNYQVVLVEAVAAP
jgi:hypothetical protein